MKIKKPWGKVKEYVQNQTSTVRLISITANEVTSLHKHHLRDDMWVILDDGIKVQINDDVFETKEGDEYVIPAESIHRIITGKKPGRVLEIAFGYTDEEDIERLEDDHGRIIID